MNRTKVLLLCLAALVVILITGSAFAATNTSSFDTDWWVLSGGGAPSSAGVFEMNGSLGQTVIGSSASASYSIDHGYWLKGSYKTFMPLLMKQ